MEQTNISHIIFLDIDGCVNSDNFYEKRIKGNFDPEVIALLNSLKYLNVEVVVSSSWGEEGVIQLKNVGLELPIIGCTEHFYADWFCRGNEIEKWLVKNMGGIGTKFGNKYKNKEYNYVIIDDDSDMLLGQKDNFVHIDRKTGITKKDIEKIVEILEK